MGFMTEEVKSTGKMVMPSMYDSLLGGHAVMAIGYDDEEKVFVVRNSWGEEWGDSGYFYMPYDYITHPLLVRDLWTIRFVDGKALPTKPMSSPIPLAKPTAAAVRSGLCALSC